VLDGCPVEEVAKELGKAVNFRKVALNSTDRFLDIAQYLEVKFENEKYPITVGQKEPEELRDLINGFYDGAVDLRDLLLKIDEKLNIQDTLCSVPTVTMQDIKELAHDTRNALNKLNKWKDHIEKNKALLSVDVEKLKNDCQRNPGNALCGERDKLLSTQLPGVAADMSDKAATVVTTADALERYVENISRADSNTAKALIAVRFLETHKAFGDKVLGKFKRHILFFAELSDAGSTEQTKEILEAYTMPPVSFAVKRERYKNHVLLSSYLGYAYGKVVNAGTFTEDNRKGIYAPVGLEFSRGLGGGASVSLMLAPFDFGYPITLKLNGIKQNIDFNEIVAPSTVISYGFANYPLCVGAAYQRGRKATTAGTAEERVLFFIAMGALNLIVAYNFSTEQWVDFKLFGGIGLMLLFVIGQALFLARHLEEGTKP